MVKSEKREMSVKKIKFVENKKAVSTIIGALLMFAILVGMYGAVQSTMVPVWNKGVEYDHLDVVYSDMMSMKSDIEDVALHTSPKSSDIHLGVRYPERMLFMNPGEGAPGMLSVESDVEIAVNYTVDVAGETASETIKFTSSRITYELYGTINSPKYVYEHGIIIRDFRTSSVTADEQLLIVGDDIYIPILNASVGPAKSSLDVESLNIHPYPETSSRTYIKYVNITMDTAYPKIWWDPEYRAEFEAQFLEEEEDEIPNELKSRDILGHLGTDYTTVNVSGNKIYINSTATREITSPSGNTTGTINAGILTFRSTVPRFPFIGDIKIKGISDTTSNITATVNDVTAPFDIHADLSDLMKDWTKYDVRPNCSLNESYPISATSWDWPNTVTVRWSNIVHANFAPGVSVAVIFRVYNSDSKLEHTTISTFFKPSRGTYWEEY